MVILITCLWQAARVLLCGELGHGLYCKLHFKWMALFRMIFIFYPSVSSLAIEG